MTLKEFNFSVLFLVLLHMGHAQFDLSGTVSDPEGRALPDAEVYLKALDLFASTNSQGEYRLQNIPQGHYELIVFAYGYRINKIDFFIEGNREVNAVLEPLGEQLSEVIVTQQRKEVFALKQLRKVEGTAIYAGKKSEVVLLSGLTGNMAANNARQIYSQVVGLNIYDGGDAGLQLNIGGRGLRSQTDIQLQHPPKRL